MIGVGCLASLEEDVRVLCGTTHVGRVGVHPPAPELDYFVIVDERSDFLVREQGNFRQFMRSPEPVEEVEEGHARFQSGGVGDQGEVVSLLDRAGRQHCKTGCPGMHHIGVVAEDRQGMCRQGTGGDVNHCGSQLPGDLEHVGYHQQQALRRGESGGQSPLLQRTVQSAGRAGFRLHLDDVGHLAPEVLFAGRRPVVGVLAHRGRRRDRVDRDHFRKGVCDAGSSLVAVDADPLAYVHASSLACGTCAPLSSPTVARGPR